MAAALNWALPVCVEWRESEVTSFPFLVPLLNGKVVSRSPTWLSPYFGVRNAGSHLRVI